MGALPLKSTVYVLPALGSSRSQFEWLAKELRSAGGEAILCEARLIGGLSDEEVREQFRSDRDELYQQVRSEIEELLKAPPPNASARMASLRRRFEEIRGKDYFDSPGRSVTERSLDAAEAELKPLPEPPTLPVGSELGTYREHVWVTRRNVHVDRMACSWLIRRFVDPAASFRFVDEDFYERSPGEVRFDMYEAEFTHRGDQCTFEVLAQIVDPANRALRAIAEIVHDIDLPDGKFGRDEAAGIGRVIDGIRAASPSDDERIVSARELFEGLYRSFGGSPQDHA